MKLTFRRTDSTGTRTIELEGADCYVAGRRGDIVLDDERCSRQHALFFQDLSGYLQVKDLGSTNGTYVDGRRVQQSSIEIGSVIKFGGVTLELVELDSNTLPRGEAPRAQEAKEPEPEPVVLKGWPDNFRAVDRETLEKFVDFIDEEGRKKSVRLVDILATREKDWNK